MKLYPINIHLRLLFVVKIHDAEQWNNECIFLVFFFFSHVLDYIDSRYALCGLDFFLCCLLTNKENMQAFYGLQE